MTVFIAVYKGVYMKKLIASIIGVLLVTVVVSWYFLPRQFYLLDTTIASMLPVNIDPADPEINTLAALDTFIAEELVAGNVPGAAVALISDGEIVWEQAYGYANVADAVPVTTDTAFHVGSVSKAYMGVAVMHAIEAGELGLDDEINTILPFEVKHPGYPDVPITVRHLVTHTSGITDSLAYIRSYGVGDPSAPLGAFLEDYLVPGGQRYSTGNFTDAAPGEVYEYTNVGAGLAGYVLEAATGTPFNVYVRDKIFLPLDMQDSGYFQGEFGEDTVVARAYVRQTTPYGYVSYPTYPDGMIRASVNDVAVFLAMVMNGGVYNETQVLSAEATDVLLTSALETTPNTGIFWDLNEGADDNRHGHNGGDPGAMAFMYFNEDTRLGAVLLVNTDTYRAQSAALNILSQIFNGEGMPDVLGEVGG